MDIMEKDLKKISVNNFNELSRSETNNMEKKVNHHQSNQFPPTPFLLI